MFSPSGFASLTPAAGKLASLGNVGLNEIKSIRLRRGAPAAGKLGLADGMLASLGPLV